MELVVATSGVNTRLPLKGAIVLKGGNDAKPLAIWVYTDEETRGLLSKPSNNITIVDDNGAMVTPQMKPQVTLIASQEVNEIKGGRQELYGNFKLLSSAILIKEGESVNVEEEKRNFLRKVISSMPIPYEEEWMDDLMEEMSVLMQECRILGETPYKKALLLNIEFDENLFFVNTTLNKILVRTHGKYLFKKKFKRVPKIKALLHLKDVEGFNFKAWQRTLKQGEINPEKFEDEVYKKFEIPGLDFVRLFEVLEDHTVDVLKTAKEHEVEHRFISGLEEAAYNAKKAKNRQLIAKNAAGLKRVLQYLGKNESMERFVSVIVGRLLHDFYARDLSKNPKDIVADMAAKNYPEADEVAKEAGLTRKAAELFLNENQYKKYEEQFLRYYKDIVTSAKKYPTLNGKIEGTEYSWESIDFSSPNAWFVGLETNCCQHLESAGKSCLIYGASHPETSGIFRVMKKGQTVAQSWFWIKNEAFVFDNIEALGKEMRSSVFRAYLQFAKEIVKRRYFGIKKITIGLGFNDGKDYTERLPEDKEPVTLGGSTYSDASHQVLLWDSTYGFHITEKEI